MMRVDAQALTLVMMNLDGRDQRSRVFTSNLDDAEAVFGDDSIFLNKLLSADEWLDSKFLHC